MNILTEIIAHKKKEIADKKAKMPLDYLKRKIHEGRPPRDFKAAVSRPGKLNFICEVKKASPSTGILIEEYSPSSIASLYEKNGASAISVLTENKYFQGDICHLSEVKESVGIPVLRKDFLVDEYQLYEARAFGADAVLLIAAILGAQDIEGFLQLSKNLGMATVVEVHNEYELEKALSTSVEIVGINNRNLRDLTCNLDTTLRLKKMIPEGKVIISESGIKTGKDISLLKEAGVNAVLIGQALLESKNIGEKMRELGI